MKKPYGFSFFSILSLLFFILSVNANANWINTGIKSSGSSEPNIQSSEKKDSLPEGVTQDWLNSLRDENGNKIIPENNTRRMGEIPEDPGGDAMQQKVFDGFHASSFFGASVSSAGDVNGDGYDDIVIGAYIYNSNTGRAYIYFGGSIMNTVPDIVLTGTANSDFGYSVSTAGDVNGDGYSDVIIGTTFGGAYIYFGGASMNNIADVIMTGEASNSEFGVSVSTAGDVNGDGYSDVIIGARAYNSNTGKAYIFFGGNSMDNIADVTMTGEAPGDYFGVSVSTAGDVNGDGYEDVVIGAWGYISYTGRAYMFFGGSSMDNTADVTMTGEAANNYFGYSVSTAGDVNGDGYSDVIIGAIGYNFATGRAYIFFGGSSMDNIADVIMTSETMDIAFAQSVSTAGDVNGDGYSDVIIGAPSYNSSTGRAYIYFGGASMNDIADIILTGETAGNLFGESVSTAGDVNGDGYSDVLVGAFGFNSSTGRVYLFDYFMKNEIIPDISTTGEAANNNFGYSVANAGDVNGDGFTDIIVGATGYSSNRGSAYIYYGGLTPDTIADVTLTGPGVGTFFGIVSSAGDINNDGYDDVIVGSYGFDNFRGRAFIYFGGSPMDNGSDVILTGEQETDYFGASVSGAGDVNGDGYDDVLVGAQGNSSNTGRAYLYFGGDIVDNVEDAVFTGGAANNYFGYSVSAAGDVNGDGYSDLIVGAKGYSSSTGRAYIYLGGNPVNNVADVTMTGGAANNLFGISVSGAGDVNRDGYDDVIVGASGYSTNTGRAYIFLGGSTMNNVSDVTMTGGTTNDSFGVSVSSAGDLNNDGYPDVIVGSNANSSQGAAYIFFGGMSMDNAADVNVKSKIANEHLGYSASSAGDFNGDGYDDIIAGAWGFNSNTGRAYIYMGSEISAKPILIHVNDVPNDQGGKVQIKWAKSSREAYGFNNITNYLVYRSEPPGASGFQWEQVADITAVNFPFYYYTSNTISDSSSVSNGSTYFFIKARNSNTGEFWNSNILYGTSIDNLSPDLVSPFTATSSGVNVRLNWKKSTAADLLNYILFRSTSPTIDPHTETPLAIVTDSTYLDTTPLSGTYYYFIVAQDIHNNYSPVAVTESPNITVNLTMFIEGFYNPASDMQVSDTIQAYLRNTVSPYGVVDNAISTVTSGGISILKFSSAAGGTYYLVVTHRNSIETWSASGLILTPGSTVNYDLSTSSSQAYGNNMIQVDASPVRFAVYSGDVNQDGVINAIDVGAIDNDAFNFSTGYINSDVTGNNVTDAADLAIADNNAFNYVSKVRP